MLLKTATLGESKESKEVRNLFLKLVLVVFVVCGGFFVSTNVMADGGGWTGSGTSIDPSGTPGGPYGSGGCSGDNANYLLGCTGFSWIYYKYVGGNAGRGQDITFRPYNNNSNGGFVSGECAREDGGFWHFGRNARGFSYGGYASYNYVYGFSDDTYVYNATYQKWGHMESYTYGTYINYSNFYDWSNVPGGSAYFTPSGLGQDLYKKIGNNYVKMYETVKTGDVNAVFNDYKEAYEYANGTSYSGGSMPSSVYAFCYWDGMSNVTLTAESINTNGSSLASLPGLENKTVTVRSGSLASLVRGTTAGYSFKGWKERKNSSTYVTDTNTNSSVYVSGTTEPKGRFNVKALTADKTVYAVYEIQQKTLTGIAVTTNGSRISGVNNVTSTVNYGSPASVTRPVITGYTFKGWRLDQYSGTPSGGATYRVNELLANVKVYAVYEAQQRTLTGIAVDAGGNILSGVDNVTSTVNYGAAASITRRTVSNYTFMGWRSSPTGTNYLSTGITYTVNSLTSNTTVYAVYERNAFQGRARVFEGSNTSGTNSKSTGWVSGNNAQNLTIDCANSGCNATFDIYLRTVSGAGVTNYAVYKSKNGGNNVLQTNVVPASPSSFPTGGGAVLKVNGKTAYIEKLYPGEEICYLIVFRPYGSNADSDRAKLNVCAQARASTFQGKTDAGSTTTGWKNEDTTKRRVITNCASSGCEITFKHSLRRVTGAGSTNYVVKRSSNYWVSTQNLGIPSNSNLKNGTETFASVANGTEVVEFTENIRLVPGQVVCESITFGTGNNTTSSLTNATTRVCVSATGNAQPSSNTLINMQVKNNNVVRYNNYQKNVYAKPFDVLSYRATYDPVLQYTYNLLPQAVKITCLNGATGIYTNTRALKLGEMFNSYRSYCDSSLGAWKNSFSVKSTGFSMTTINYGPYANGDTTRREETNSHTVSYAEVGRRLTESAVTNLNDSVKTTPSQVFFTDGTEGNTGNVVTYDLSDNADAWVPYNFTTEVNVTKDDATYFYAGEKNQVSYEITVKTKSNSLTMNSGDRNYATRVDGARHKIIIYRGAQRNGNSNYMSDNLCAYYGLPNDRYTCGYASEVNKTTLHNNASKMYEDMSESKTANFYVQDLTAGEQVCIAAAVYPSTSGADNNTDSRGSNTWNISDSKCFRVAKKPNLQAWGGNVYAAGKINTATSIKNNVAGYTDYNIEKENNYNYVFGSWGELGVIAGGRVTGFASGAGTGYASEGPGGSKEPKNATNIFLRSTLTFANSPGSDTYVNGLGTAANFNGIQNDKSVIVSNLVGEDTKNVSGEVDLNDESKLQDNGVYYYYGESDDLLINGALADNGKIQLVHTKGNITINGDIRYAGDYTKFEDVPKVVIYAKNVLVGCHVGRVDAVLIADEKVVTCGKDGTDEDTIKANINDEANSNQLRINGAIIAKKLIANRTYGAAAGINSIVSAEIIDFDPTLYLWEKTEAEETNANRHFTTYMHELSPRL